uniref:hypothetical protein n=1 Tax=Kitasatospora sp. NBC_01519 TaxID=2903576 RepID=UPI002F918C03
MQAEAVTWSTGTAGRHRCRLSVFEAMKAKALLPVLEKPFVLARWSTATVGPDILLLTERARDSAVQGTDTRSRVYVSGRDRRRGRQA